MMRPMLVLSVAMLLAAAAPALAGPREDVLYGISRCGGIADDHSWLDCVYGAAQPMRGALGLPPAPASQTRLVPPAIPGMAAPAMGMAPAVAAAPARPVKKSLWGRLWEEGHDPVVSDALMESYKFDRKGFFTVTLSDGEVWTQDPREHNLAGWRDKPGHYVVTITPDDNNIMRLSVAGESNTYRVTRAK